MTAAIETVSAILKEQGVQYGEISIDTEMFSPNFSKIVVIDGVASMEGACRVLGNAMGKNGLDPDTQHPLITGYRGAGEKLAEVRIGVRPGTEELLGL